jgi:hypothetical protein
MAQKSTADLARELELLNFLATLRPLSEGEQKELFRIQRELSQTESSVSQTSAVVTN